jgi:translation initiation factor 1
MNQIDWNEALGKAFNVPMPNEDNTPDEATAQEPARGDALQQQGKQMLDIILERKGRAGKQATIVTGFTCDEEALKQVASQLKRVLGEGGSARGGEILIQGDFRQRVLDQLTSMGFKARVI